MTRARAVIVVIAAVIALAGGCASSGSQAEQVVAAVESDSPAPASPQQTTAPVDAPGSTSPTPVTIETAPTPSAEPSDVATQTAAGASPTAVPPASTQVAASTPLVVAATPPPTAPTSPVVVPTSGVVVLPTAVVAPTVAPGPTASSLVVDIANGAEGYAVSCANCHSQNGLGTFQAAGLIGVGQRYTRQSMIDELTYGHPFTFGFADELSDEEIAAIAAFVIASF